MSSEKVNYLDDVAFTAEILKTKVEGKISKRAIALYGLLLSHLLKKHLYRDYPFSLKDEMIDFTMEEFYKKYNTFSIYRAAIMPYFSDTKKNKVLKRGIFYQKIGKVIAVIEKGGDYLSVIKKEFDYNEESIKAIKEKVEEIDADVSPRTGAFNFFTMFSENNFKKVIKKFYKDQNKYEEASKELLVDTDEVETFDTIRETYGI